MVVGLSKAIHKDSKIDYISIPKDKRLTARRLPPFLDNGMRLERFYSKKCALTPLTYCKGEDQADCKLRPLDLVEIMPT